MARLAIKMVPFYFSYLKKRIKQDKILVSLSGINVLQKNGEWLTFLGDEKIDTTYRGILCPFNGVRDLFFIEVSEEMTYQACYLPKAPGYNQVLEVMFHNKKLFDGGLIWFHLRPCLQKHTETYQYWYEKAKHRFISVEKFKKCNYSKLKRRKNLFICSRFERMFFENDSIEQNFPRLFLYANTFETILRILNPNKVVCLTSSKTYQKELLLAFAKNSNIKIEFG